MYTSLLVPGRKSKSAKSYELHENRGVTLRKQTARQEQRAVTVWWPNVKSDGGTKSMSSAPSMGGPAIERRKKESKNRNGQDE